eukprot:SM000416S15663  [mRNA]  locus=s416:20535:28850:+ [translate_table: standard]
MQCTLDSLLVCSTGIAENILNELLYTVQPACCAAILANNKPSTCFCNTWLGKAVVAAEGRMRVVTLQALKSCNIPVETVGIPGTPACPPPPPRPSLHVPPSPGLRGERDALLRIRAAVADPQGNLTGWSAAYPDPCNWVGVTCSRAGGRFAVTTLDLMDLRLEGKLPAEGGLGNLTQLVRLYLARNNLTGPIPPELGRLQHGPIPDELGNCTDLKILDINGNLFVTGMVPASLGRLKHLWFLYLSRCSLTGPLPPELAGAKSLEVLDIETRTMLSPGLTGPIPPELGSLPRLRTLRLRYNSLTGPIPAALSNCTSLVILVLAGNRLHGHIPPELGRLSKLAYLHLSDNFLEGSLPDELGNLSSLSWLAIARAGLSGRIPSSLGRLQLLYNVLLSENRLTGEIPPELSSRVAILALPARLTGTLPRELGAMKKLLTLDVRGNLLEGPIPPELGNATRLSILSLSGNRFTGGIPVELGQLGDLKRLELAGNLLTGPIPPSLGNCTNLFQLNVSYNGLVGPIPMELGNIRNASVMDIYLPSFKQPNVTKLQYIDITSNALSGPLPATLGRLSAMQAFYFSSNQLTGSIPPDISNCYQLLQLNLSHNKLSGPLWPGLGLLTNLTKVDLSNNAFTGSIPSELHSLSAAQTLDLAHNRFSGNISPELGLLVSVTRLALDSNILDGPIPTELGNMSSLEDLDLSNNKLTGPIPATLGDLPLIILNVSHNKMTPDFVDRGSDIPPPTSAPAPPKHKDSNSNVGVILGCSLGGSAAIIGLLILFCWKWRRHSRDLAATSKSFDDAKAATGNGRSNTDIMINYLHRATLKEGLEVAVKKLEATSLQGEKEFLAEVATLGRIKHRHLVSLRGAYVGAPGDRQWLLIYDFVNGGNLDSYLRAASSMMSSTTATTHEASNQEMHLALGAQEHTAEQLAASGVPVVEAKSLLHDAEEQKRRWDFSCNWATRKRIAIEIAHGLAYLHHGCSPPIIHRDVKPSNVLLNINLRVQLSDFGLARQITLGDTHVSTGVAGHSAQQIAAPQLVVPEASAADIWQDILGVIKVGLLCTATEPSSRPTMAETLHLLENKDAVGLKPSPNWQLSASPSAYSSAAGPASLSGSSFYSILRSTSESQSTIDCTLENVLVCSTAAGEDILNEALYTVQPACCAAVRANTRPDKCRCIPWFPRAMAAAEGLPLATTLTTIASCNISFLSLYVYGTPSCPPPSNRTAPEVASTPGLRAERDALLRVKAALADPQGNLSTGLPARPLHAAGAA